MATKTVNGIPAELILKSWVDFPPSAERIPGRSDRTLKMDIVDPDPQWPEYFEAFKARILAVFDPSFTPPASLAYEPGEDAATTTTTSPTEAEPAPFSEPITVLAINHVGSTSVPGLPAKAVIDIDLALSANHTAAEHIYVPRLRAAGFEFRIREKLWYEHRFFCAWESPPCNLHVWGPACPEVERHVIFRDWLRAHPADRDQYGQVKRECIEAAKGQGETLLEYTQRKDWVIEEIRAKAFREMGLLE